MNNKSIVFLTTLLLPYALMAYDPLAPFKMTLKTTETATPSSYEKQVQFTQKELSDTTAANERVQAELEKVDSEKRIAKGQLALAKSSSERAIISRRISGINQVHQILTDLEQVYQQTKLELEERLKRLQEVYADPNFAHLRFTGKDQASFNDVQEFAAHLANSRQLLNDANNKRALILNDIENRRKTLNAVSLELQEKQEQRDKDLSDDAYNTLIQQLTFKKELAEAKLKEAEFRLESLDVDYQLARKKTTIYKEEYNRIKRIVAVDASYVKKIELQLEKERTAFFERQAKISSEIKALNTEKEENQQKLQELRNKYSLSNNDLVILREWNKAPKTLNEWVIVAQAGALITQDLLLETVREYLESQLEYDKASLRQKELNAQVIKSWHKMTLRKFRSGSDSAIEQDIKSYATPKAELQADLAALTEKRNAALAMLDYLNKVIDKIKALSAELKQQKQLLFKDAASQYSEISKLFVQAEDNVRERRDTIAKLIGTYSNTIATVSESSKKIEDVLADLGSKGWWQQQSIQAIEWSELKNFFPDLKQFFSDFLSDGAHHFSSDYWRNLLIGFKNSLFHPQNILHALLQLVICCILFYILKLYIPDFKRHLLMVSPDYGALATGSYFVAGILGFIYERLLGLYVWGCLFFYIKAEYIADSFIASLFYLCSIPYLLYITHEFMRYFIRTNKQRGYVFISQVYQSRFVLVVFPLIAATVVIFFLREAFIQGHYPTSQVPVILLAINFILLQVALLCLISKEQIVSLIPTRTPLWEWVAETVDRYYYAILMGVIAIIIMSNPYVGYGRQVLYVLSRMFFTILLIPLFSWLHNRLKRTSSDLFFYYADSESIRERFTAAKTWYGFFVVFSFLLFILIGVVIGAAIWGKVIGLRDINNWLNYELYSPGINEVTGKKIEITALSLFHIVGFVIGGIILTYIINYFLLRRIFDPLLVGAGIQNTILTLTKYIIIVIALLIGLQSAGLDTLTTKLAVIVGVIGFAIQEPVGDFFSYFIILVQRPIGIGDLIQLDEDIMGVVRQITPRSTILRRRNSVTIIVPNSHILKRPVTNWNYTRTFFAFEDMLITVPYHAEPHAVRLMILKVLDENHNILKNPAPIVWLHNFVDNGFQFLVRGYLTADKTLYQWDIASEVRLEIVRRLRGAGIDIASPTRIIKVLGDTEKNPIG